MIVEDKKDDLLSVFNISLSCNFYTVLVCGYECNMCRPDSGIRHKSCDLWCQRIENTEHHYCPIFSKKRGNNETKLRQNIKNSGKYISWFWYLYLALDSKEMLESGQIKSGLNVLQKLWCLKWTLRS